LGEGVTMVAGKAGKAAVDGIKTASHKVTEGVNFVASTAKGFADKIGSLWNKGATTVKTTFLQGNEKIQHAVKTLMEYKWIPGEGKGFAIAGVGNVSGGGQYSLKEAYQYMESKVVKGTGDIGTPPRYGERRISKELYDELRDGTPTAKLREKVNEGIEDKIGTPDPALPGKYITDRLQADHIVSMKNIAKMENFDKLTKEQQLKVLNNEENFLGLSEAANKSKGSKSYSDWTIYKKEKIEVDPKFREEMIKKEKELEMKLQKQIDDFVEGNKKDIDK
ncbi:TPA: hypothetical protein ACOQ5J_006014, partial [Bacillus cereus]